MSMVRRPESAYSSTVRDVRWSVYKTAAMCVSCSWLRSSAAFSEEMSSLVRLFLVRPPIATIWGVSDTSCIFSFLLGVLPYVSCSLFRCCCTVGNCWGNCHSTTLGNISPSPAVAVLHRCLPAVAVLGLSVMRYLLPGRGRCSEGCYPLLSQNSRVRLLVPTLS